MGDTMALLQPRMALAFRALPALCHVPFTSTVAFRSLRSLSNSNPNLRTSFAAHAAVLERAELSATTAGFGELGLGTELLTAVSEHRLNSPTEIQVSCSPWISLDRAPYYSGLGGLLCLPRGSRQRLTSRYLPQTAAIPEILRGGDVLLASHTGSGKTLAYLLPLVSFPCLLRCRKCMQQTPWLI